MSQKDQQKKALNYITLSLLIAGTLNMTLITRIKAENKPNHNTQQLTVTFEPH